MEDYVTVASLLEEQSVGQSHQTSVFDHPLLVTKSVGQEGIVKSSKILSRFGGGDFDDRRRMNTDIDLIRV